MITREQAIEIAKKEFANQGRSEGDYNITVDPENTNGKYWMIWFDKKGPFPIPGGKHLVRVDKTTGHAEFMAGE